MKCKGYTFAYTKYHGIVPFDTTHYKVFINKKVAEDELKDNKTDMVIVECEVEVKEEG